MPSLPLGVLAGSDASRISRQARLDLLDVAIGLRPAARILVRLGGELDAALGLFGPLGLDACAARGLARVPVGASFADSFAADACRNVERMAILYVAMQRHRAESARSCDERSDDGGLGEVLGYPDCCIRAVLARGGVPSMADSIGLYSTAGFFDPLVWPPAAVADGPLLPHFPCGTECAASRRLASARWEGACEHLPEIAVRVRRAAQARYWVDGRGVARSDAVEGSLSPRGLAVVQAREDLPRGPG